MATSVLGFDQVQLTAGLPGPSQASAEPENPLLQAITNGDLVKFNEIFSKSPGLAKVKNLQLGGYTTTALHLAILEGKHQMVKALVGRHPKLCQVRDKSSRTPLQLAAEMGASKEVIVELVSACPRSLQQATERKETVFVLALKNKKVDAFEVLLEEAKKLNKVHLLDRKDWQGNNVLHIAASKKLSKAVKMLLPRHPMTEKWVRVNSLNKLGQTALDICDQLGPRDKLNNEIDRILRDAGARARRHFASSVRTASTLATKNVILVLIGIVIGASFTAICSIPPSFLVDNSVEGAVFHVGHLLQGLLPPVFYLLVFNTANFVVAMFANLVILWQLPFRPVILFMTVNAVIVYYILLDSVMPKFWVKFRRHHSAVSTHMVFASAMAIILCSAVVYYIFYGSYMCLLFFMN